MKYLLFQSILLSVNVISIYTDVLITLLMIKDLMLLLSEMTNGDIQPLRTCPREMCLKIFRFA